MLLSLLSRVSFRRLAAAGLTLAYFGTLPFVTYAQTASSPTAPTAAQEPVLIDQAWQKASAKYDAQRSAMLKEVDRVDHQGPFRPDWESLQKYEVPEWYKDAKFGIFIHWGVYSVPAFGNEWYPRKMYREGFGRYTSTTSPLTDRKTSLATRISFQCSRPNTLTRRPGPSCSRNRARNMWCPWPSIMTASPCMTAA